MRRLIINENDGVLFNSPFHPEMFSTYLVYLKELRRMVRQQGQGFWIMFITSFRTYAVNNGGTAYLGGNMAEDAFIDMLKMLICDDNLLQLSNFLKSLEALSKAIRNCDYEVVFHPWLRYMYTRFSKPFDTIKLYFRFFASFMTLFHRWQGTHRARSSSPLPKWKPPVHWTNMNLFKGQRFSQYEMFLKKTWGKELQKLVRLDSADICWLDLEERVDQKKRKRQNNRRRKGNHFQGKDNSSSKVSNVNINSGSNSSKRAVSASGIVHIDSGKELKDRNITKSKVVPIESGNINSKTNTQTNPAQNSKCKGASSVNAEKKSCKQEKKLDENFVNKNNAGRNKTFNQTCQHKGANQGNKATSKTNNDDSGSSEQPVRKVCNRSSKESADPRHCQSDSLIRDNLVNKHKLEVTENGSENEHFGDCAEMLKNKGNHKSRQLPTEVRKSTERLHHAQKNSASLEHESNSGINQTSTKLYAFKSNSHNSFTSIPSGGNEKGIERTTREKDIVSDLGCIGTDKRTNQNKKLQNVINDEASFDVCNPFNKNDMLSSETKKDELQSSRYCKIVIIDKEDGVDKKLSSTKINLDESTSCTKRRCHSQDPLLINGSDENENSIVKFVDQGSSTKEKTTSHDHSIVDTETGESKLQGQYSNGRKNSSLKSDNVLKVGEIIQGKNTPSVMLCDDGILKTDLNSSQNIKGNSNSYCETHHFNESHLKKPYDPSNSAQNNLTIDDINRKNIVTLSCPVEKMSDHEIKSSRATDDTIPLTEDSNTKRSPSQSKTEKPKDQKGKSSPGSESYSKRTLPSGTSYGHPLPPPHQRRNCIWLYVKCDNCNILEHTPGLYKRCSLCVKFRVQRPKTYCGKHCQFIDWNKRHKKEHYNKDQRLPKSFEGNF